MGVTIFMRMLPMPALTIVFLAGKRRMRKKETLMMQKHKKNGLDWLPCITLTQPNRIIHGLGAHPDKQLKDEQTLSSGFDEACWCFMRSLQSDQPYREARGVVQCESET